MILMNCLENLAANKEMYASRRGMIVPRIPFLKEVESLIRDITIELSENPLMQKPS